MAAETEPVGLVLPGGGARCAYQAGALTAIAEMMPGTRSPFSVIAGQSGGAINAARLAAGAADFGASVARLAASWSELKVSDIVRSDPVSVGWRGLLWILMAASGGLLVANPRSFFDNAPLGELLRREIDFDAIAAAIARGHLSALALSASSYSEESGQAVTFFAGAPGVDEWFRIRRSGLRRRIALEHVLASAALPFVFPAQAIEGRYFGDGALRMTAPLSPAIRLGARRLLIIAARDPEVAPHRPAAEGDYPSLGALVGHMLDIVFNDFLDTDIERLERINHTLSLLDPVKLTETPLRPIRAIVLRPSEDLRVIAGRRAHAMPWAVRMFLRAIGGWGRDWRLPSYLNFDGSYCRDLIDLGYRDAQANAAEITDLLRPEGRTAPGV